MTVPMHGPPVQSMPAVPGYDDVHKDIEYIRGSDPYSCVEIYGHTYIATKCLFADLRVDLEVIIRYNKCMFVTCMCTSFNSSKLYGRQFMWHHGSVCSAKYILSTTIFKLEIIVATSVSLLL